MRGDSVSRQRRNMTTVMPQVMRHLAYADWPCFSYAGRMPAPSSSPLLVLRSYLGPLKWAVLTLALLLLTGTGLNLYLPQILGRFVDNAKLGAGADIALLSRLAGDPPDLSLHPRVRDIGMSEFFRAREAIDLGYAEAQRQLPEIARLAESLPRR